MIFPPAPSFAATESQQAGPKQLQQDTEVIKQTAAGAIESTRFTLNGFTYYFTFFSKFFSSFPHGTCSLSVSSKYLALGRIYVPLCTAVPSNTTLSTGTVTGVSQKRNGAIILYGPLSQQRVILQRYLQAPGSKPQLPRHKGGDFRIAQFPLHSPLLRESLLLSFPPLNNMFKFSGSSYLSSAQIIA